MCPDRNPICIGNTELSLGTADSDGLSYGDRVQHGLGASGLCDPVCLVARGQGAHPTQPPFQRSLLPCSGLGAGWHRFHSLRWAGKDPHCGCRLKLFQKQLIFIGHRCSESFCASLRRTLQVWWQRRSRHREWAPFCRATGGLSWGLRGAAGRLAQCAVCKAVVDSPPCCSLPGAVCWCVFRRQSALCEHLLLRMASPGVAPKCGW